MKLIGQNAVTLFHEGNLLTITSDDSRFKAAYKLLTKNDEKGYLELFKTDPIQAALKKVVKAGADFFTFKDGEVFFGDYKVTGALAQKVESMQREELDLTPFVAFAKRLVANPNPDSVLALYNFLGYKELPITSDGYFIGYKGVQDDYYSSTGNTTTRVLKGVVDSRGRILNNIGAEIEVEREDVDPDPRSHCSHGLHVGSYNYAKGHAQRVVMVKVDPADVVTCPNDCNFQKLRVCRYFVVADYKAEILAPVVVAKKGEDKIVEVKGTGVTSETIDRIKNYIARYAADGYSHVSLKAVSGSLSPAYVKKDQLAAIINKLGWVVKDGWVEL